MRYEYVNDAFAQMMGGTPEEYVSGRRTLHFPGFPSFIKEVNRTKERRQIELSDEISGRNYSIAAYSQENGFCSFVVLRTDHS